MSKKLYLISGVPCRMSENSREFKNDLKIFRENDEEVTVRIPLSLFGAIITRLQISQYNLTHPCCMKMTKACNKRYRV